MKNKSILLFVMLIPFCYILFYVWNTTGNIVFRDDIYLIKDAVIERYCTGTLNFSDLWRTSGAARLLGYNLLQVVNISLFGLNSRFVSLLIPVVLLSVACLLYRDYRKSLDGIRSPEFIQVTYFFLMMLLFNVALWEGLTFSYAIVFSWPMPFFIASFYVIEHLLVTGEKRYWVPAGTLPVLAVLVFGGANSFPFAAALGLAFTCHLFINRPSLPKGSWRRILAVSTILGVSLLLYSYGIYENNYFPGGRLFLREIVAAPWKTMQFDLVALGASVVGVDAADQLLSFPAMVGLGGVVVLIYGLATYLYFKTQMYHRTYLPLFLLTYALAFLVFMTVGRFGYGVRYGMAPRYSCDATIYGVIAIAWIAIYNLAKSDRQTLKWRMTLYQVLALIYLGASLTTVVEWRIQPYRKAYFAELQKIALRVDSASDDELARFEERPALVRESLKVLRDHRLNVYKNVARPGVALAQPPNDR